MLKVGLTGGIGSGKSTVSHMFREQKIPVIDADVISREIFEIYPNISEEIKKEFGSSFFDECGNLKRKELGSYIFKDKKRKETLEAITLPYILKETFNRLEQCNANGDKICVVDAPTLIEVGMHNAMDLNILVWVDLNTQIERVKRRDNLKDEEILNRIKSQMPIDEKKNYVNFVIDNKGSIEYTKEQFKVILEKLINYEVVK